MDRTKETTYGPIPTEWSIDKLYNLCVQPGGIQTGPFGSQLHQKDYVCNGTPIITVEHLGENRILHENLPCVSKEDRSRLAKYAMKEGDIIFSRVGSVDRRALVRKEEDGWLFSGRCLRVRPDQGKVNPAFLSYFFGLPAFKEHIQRIAVGATMPSLNTEIMSNIDVILPPLKDQDSIARILNTLDGKIENNRQKNEIIESIASIIFRSWFIDFDPTRAKVEGKQPFGMDDETAALFPSEFDDSEIGDIPNTWNIKSIIDIAELNSSTLRKEDNLDRIDYIEISEVSRGEIHAVQTYRRGEEPSRARRRLRHGDTVLSTVRPDRGSYFLSLNPSVYAVASTGFTIVTPIRVPWSFIYCGLTQPSIFEYLGQQADGGAYPAIRPEVIGNLKIAVPDNRVILDKFHHIVAPLLEIADTNRKQSSTLTKLRSILLPKLLSGELRVQFEGVSNLQAGSDVSTPTE